MQNFEKLMTQVPSLLTKRHAHIIYGLVRWLQPTKVLEIGAYHGYTTCFIAKALKDNGLTNETCLYVIDNFSLHNVTSASISNSMTHAGVNDVPNYIIPQDSQTMPKEMWPDCQLAIIDGDHSYEGCLNDFNNCVEAGAECIVIHDIVDWWGPRKFTEAIRSLNNHSHQWDILEINFDSGLAILMKPSDKPEAGYKEGASV